MLFAPTEMNPGSLAIAYHHGMKLAPSKFLLLTALVLCGCASTLDQDGALALAPYHIAEGGRIVVEAHLNDQGPFRFALDTGSSISVVFDKLRKQLELDSATGKLVIIHGLVTSGKYPIFNISRLKVGHESWVDARIAVLPGETAASEGIDGLLGIDFLRRYAVGFSVEDRVLRLYPPDLVRDRSYRGWASVPLERVNIGERGAMLYFFDVEIEGKAVPALFDLGAGQNLINWPAASSLGLAPTRREDREILSGALESTSVVAQFKASEVKTAGIRWRDELFLVADLGIFETIRKADTPFTILGSGLFNQRDFVIDFVSNRVLVRVAMDEADEPQ